MGVFDGLIPIQSEVDLGLLRQSVLLGLAVLVEVASVVVVVAFLENVHHSLLRALVRMTGALSP